MIKKILTILSAVLLAGFLAVTLMYTHSVQSGEVCKDIVVRMPEYEYGELFSKAEILKLMKVDSTQVLNRYRSELPLDEMENALDKFTLVSRTDLYFTTGGVLHVDIYPREPIIRIINSLGESCFIDRGGYIMTAPSDYVSYVPIATGSIDYVPGTELVNVEDIQVDGTLRQIYELALSVSKDEFWKSQIEQIVVTSGGDLAFVPRVGNHLVVLGRDGYTEKLDRLFSFYRHGINVSGWDKYSTISVKYANQIVCTQKK